MKALRRFTVRAHLPERLVALEPLSVNLRWSWDKPTQDLFEAIDPDLWKRVGCDPVALLGQVSPNRLDELAVDESFVGRLDHIAGQLDDYLARPLWYQERAAEGAEMPNGIAYFSMEFGVAEVLPNYSGGLGILAGDHLKSASDLGLPLIAVGLYYRSGYFRQSLTADGWQRENYPSLDPQGLPLRLLTDRRGRPRAGASWPCRTRRSCGPGCGSPRWVEFRCCCWTPTSRRTSTICAVSPTGCTAATRNTGSSRRCWQVSAGCGRSARSPRSRVCPTPEVFHMNEGHAGFLGVERIRELIDSGLDFDTALTVVRSSTVFTTHTPVAAGIDRFPVEMVKRYFGSGEGGSSGGTSRLLPGVSLDRIIAFGVDDDPSKFNMAIWACGSRSAPTGCRFCMVGSAGRCSTSCGPASIRPRCRSARSPTVCTRRPGRRHNGSSSAANCPAETCRARQP